MHVMRAALRLALALPLLTATLPALGEDAYTPEESINVVRNLGFMLGLMGGPLIRCDPAYNTAAVRSATEALAGRIDLWGQFDKARRLGLAEVEKKLASVSSEKIDCNHYRIGMRTMLGRFHEELPKLR